MKKFTRSTTKVLGALVFVLAMVLAIGCSENPMSSSVEQSQPVVLSRTQSSVSSALQSPGVYYAEGIISADQGGRLELYDVILEVPAGAVRNDTLFSISIPDITKFANDFGPEGLVFDKPVRVTMSYRDADLSNVDESSIRIGYWNPVKERWEDIRCDVDADRKQVTAELEHFSAYGLISD